MKNATVVILAGGNIYKAMKWLEFNLQPLWKKLAKGGSKCTVF